MYQKYWDLACRPFDHPFSPKFFFSAATHEAAKLKLAYVVENGLGLGVLCGGIGTGKTAVASLLEHELGEPFGPVVHLAFPQMRSAEVLGYIAATLDGDEAPPAERMGVDRILLRLENRLGVLAQQGRRPILIVDEAHLIEDIRAFETLHLLLNLQEAQDCSLSVLLIGGTLLLGRLERMPQLSDRIAIRSVLEPLSIDETMRYIAHRLSAAGATRDIFEPSAIEALAERSDGVPRRINRLADLALLVGYADRLSTIGADEITSVAEELPSSIAA